MQESDYQTLPDFPRYLVYKSGIILDTKYSKSVPFQTNTDGYLTCTLTNVYGKRKTVRLHRILGLCFIENINNKSEINHKDGNKQNNTIENLEWNTHSENIQHAWNMGLLQNTPERSSKIRNQVRHIGKEHFKSKPVVLVNTGEVFESGNIAAKTYNVRQEQLFKCCSGKYPAKSAGKDILGNPLKWQFLERN